MDIPPAQARRLKACLHPLRLRLLEAVSRVPGSSQSLARRLGESQPRIHYHLKRLERAGLVRIAEERRKRGVIELMYEAHPEALAAAARAASDAPDPEDPVQGVLAQLGREAAVEPPPDAFRHGASHVVRLSRRQARHLHEDLLRLLREAQARPAGPGEDYRLAWFLLPRG